MKKWIIICMLVMTWGMAGMVSAAAQEENLPLQGSMICENYKTLSYSLEGGTLTISGEGDCLQEEDKYFFNSRQEITRVVFDEKCKVEDISYMFVACYQLREVKLSPHIVNISSAFDSTGLTGVPDLPEGMENISRAFTSCMGITEIDFSKLPSSITNYTRAFQGTGIVQANITVQDRNRTGAFDFSYCFAHCPYLNSVVFNGSGLNDAAFLWMEGLCDGCSSLKSFELNDIPESNQQRGIYSAVNMFRGCSVLTTVKNCGYFFYSAAGAFEECTSLVTLETMGFQDMYAGNCLEDTFKNCRMLQGDYHVGFVRGSSIHHVARTMKSVKESVGDAFKNCSGGLSLHIGCRDLVRYLKKLSTRAKFSYWRAGDPTGGFTSKKKNVSVLKLKRYKNKTKKITGKTVKKGSIVVRVSGRTYRASANSRGEFTVKLKKKLKKNNKIRVTVKKSGYNTKRKIFRVR